MRLRAVFTSVILISLLLGCESLTDLSVIQEPTTVFLVRHAEKADSSRDPALSAAGIERAAILATTLRSAQVETLHSSDFIRTRQTAAPLAEMLGKTVQLYDPGKLEEFSETLQRTGGRHLVVGHSNTTPVLVELLGGNGGADINEATEYDRLYIVTIAADGSTTSTLLRFGKPYLPNN